MNPNGIEVEFESKWIRGRIKIRKNSRRDLNPNGFEAEFQSIDV